jgi:hypothetical protein
MWLWHPPASFSVTAAGRRGIASSKREEPVHYFGFLPKEVRPDIGTTLAAHLADEQRFDIGQPDLIGPRVGAEGPMGAFIIRAIDQQPANA